MEFAKQTYVLANVNNTIKVTLVVVGIICRHVLYIIEIELGTRLTYVARNKKLLLLLVNNQMP